MKIGPKYKIARRLGAPIFEKTQTQKFAASEQRKNKGKRPMRPRTDFALQMQEKQKTRLSYGVTNKQFSNYVKEALTHNGVNTAQVLFENLETRLDNVVYRAGLAPTRRAARQMVSHGHIKVNGKKITVPSHTVSMGDELTVKDSSIGKGMFSTREEEMNNYTAPAWLKSDLKSRKVKVEGMPKMEAQELLFDLRAVLEFYSR